MDEKILNNYKFDIGENCYIYFWDDYEPCKILERKQEFGMNYYLTDVHPNWQKEVFLRKTT